MERYNRTILNSLTAQNLSGNEKDWNSQVGKMQWGLNNTIHKTTGRTAAEVMFGTCINSEINPKLNEVIIQRLPEGGKVSDIRNEVKDRIDHDQEAQKLHYDRNRKPAKVYAEGDLVKIRKTSFKNDGKSKKLLPAYVGPYRVVEVLGNDRY